MSQKGAFIILAIVSILLLAMVKEAQYQSVKKHFPEMTRCEFLHTEEMIRITPGEKR